MWKYSKLALKPWPKMTAKFINDFQCIFPHEFGRKTGNILFKYNQVFESNLKIFSFWHSLFSINIFLILNFLELRSFIFIGIILLIPRNPIPFWNPALKRSLNMFTFKYHSLINRFKKVANFFDRFISVDLFLVSSTLIRHTARLNSKLLESIRGLFKALLIIKNKRQDY